MQFDLDDPETREAVRETLAKMDREKREARREAKRKAKAEAEARLQAALANPNPSEDDICLLIEQLPRLIKEMQPHVKAIVDYGSIPDNGGHSMSQLRETLNNLRECQQMAKTLLCQKD